MFVCVCVCVTRDECEAKDEATDVIGYAFGIDRSVI